MNTTTSSAIVARPAALPSEPADYRLPVQGTQIALARGWLGLGLAALVGSGLFTVLLVLARTPVVNGWLPGTDFFRTALVVHVDLSVLVWFAAIAGMLLTAPATMKAIAAPALIPCSISPATNGGAA